ncbi:hypothetical protein [Streptomyces triticirhizae]|uniref:Uncharacterized protein n=1 Tax=Streptomyces triticirhizae TaxID=2483353 RepID=A0A3M2LTW5_9ACTN|nr:hypothetical protein [Streptomyces triticirhizae]RMI39993.1 hypothetical protein EBN88_13655 [Streptomyces triticirhizae]
MTDTRSEETGQVRPTDRYASGEPADGVRPLGDRYASSEPADGEVAPQGDHYGDSEPADGEAGTKGDGDSKSQAVGHVPERGEAAEGDVSARDRYASGEPKDKPGRVAPVDRYAS